MSISKSVKITFPEDKIGLGSKEFHYDMRLEIGVKEASGTVPVAAIFRTLVTKLKEASDVGKPTEIMTIDNTAFQDNDEIGGDEFKHAFSVETMEGKFPKVILGFKLQTMTPLSVLKHRLMQSYLIPHNLFIKEHPGGFSHGVKKYSYGFLKDEHPDHPDMLELHQKFTNMLNAAWTELSSSDQSKWKESMPFAFSGNAGVDIPLSFKKDRISAAAEGKTRITTSAMTLNTPSKFSPLIRMLLEKLVLGRKITNLIPFALARENAIGYYNVILSQARFMEQHRNIQILQSPATEISKIGDQGQTLAQALNNHPAITRVTYERARGRYHISTSAPYYRAVIQWVEHTISQHKFPYTPSVLKPKSGSGTSQHSKYASVFSEVMSATNDSYDASTIKTTRSSAWKTRPPLDISYAPSDEAFPPLPKVPTRINHNPSTTSETIGDDTIQSAISAALKKLEAQHKAELNEFKSGMEAKIAAVEKQMKELGQSVATQTYQALVHKDSPLVTKIDHESLKHEITNISTQLTTLVQHLRLSNDSTSNEDVDNMDNTASPTRNIKRCKPSTTPERPKVEEHRHPTQKSAPSTTSSPDTEMEGCER